MTKMITRNLGVIIIAILLLSLPAYAAEPTPESNALAIDTMWVMLAGFLVFLMHAGFSMVEAGFTRSKNTVNILMKNTATISIGVLTFFAVGFALMFGPDFSGLVGTMGFALTARSLFDTGIPLEAFWFFQAVFAATAATIVSGAMAERTRFVTYCVFAAVITAVIYPVVGHWVWGGGWLSEMGFVDFAGSTVVHSVGGWAALVGAILVGARTGKYDAAGNPQVLLGHNLPIGALGVFLLWFGWFGFNPGSTLSGTTPDIASVATTTILAASAGGVSAMVVSSLRYNKPDASLTLNGILAGLVGITAGTAAVEPLGAIAIGLLAGLLLVFAIEFFDKVVKVDDPVGAISVHGICGAFGTLAVGIFATDGGLLYGGGFSLLGVQAVGVLAVLAWTVSVSFVSFKLLDVILGLRVSLEEETLGLDISEHGQIAYGDMSLQSFGDFRSAVNAHVTSQSKVPGGTAVPNRAD